MHKSVNCHGIADEPLGRQINWIQESFPVPPPSCPSPSTRSTRLVRFSSPKNHKAKKKKKAMCPAAAGRPPHTSKLEDGSKVAGWKSTSRVEGSWRTTTTAHSLLPPSGATHLISATALSLGALFPNSLPQRQLPQDFSQGDRGQTLPLQQHVATPTTLYKTIPNLSQFLSLVLPLPWKKR